MGWSKLGPADPEKSPMSRGQMIINPAKAREIDDARSRERADRSQRIRAIAKGLMQQEGFCELLRVYMERYRYFLPGNELNAFDQGRRSAICAMVAELVGFAGEEGSNFMAETARQFAASQAKHYEQYNER